MTPRRHGATTRIGGAVACAAALAAMIACGGGEADGTDGEDAARSATDTAAATDTACADLTRIAPDSMRSADSGLQTLQVREGDGRAAAAGDTVVAHYLGCLTDGAKFDASYDRGEPIRFPLGAERVIQGWDEGLAGMRPGGVRVLRIPPGLAYGSRGTPGGPIPPDATLYFRVEMVEVIPGGGSED